MERSGRKESKELQRARKQTRALARKVKLEIRTLSNAILRSKGIR